MESEELDKKRHKALGLLKPICISLMQEFSPSTANSFLHALKEVDAGIVQEILQYLLFPLQNALHQKSLKDTELCSVCACLEVILSKASINTMQLFFDLFNPLVHSLSSPGNLNQVCAKSEEVKGAIVKSLMLLFKSSNQSVLKDVYSLRFLPAIGQVISLMLSLAEFEKSRNLQMISLDCLISLMQTDSQYGACHQLELGDFFAFCLPGITMAMTRIITGDSKQGQAVIKKALMTWTQIVHICLADSLVQRSQEAHADIADEVVDDERLRNLKVQRNEDWVKASASKLRLLLEKVCKCSSHSNWRVRVCFVESMEDLLTSCSKSLQECLPKMLESLVALINDDYGNVAKKSYSVLHTFSVAQKNSEGERTLKEILEENLHTLVTSLPRRIRMSDEEEKPTLIKMLKGYIVLLDLNISSVVNSTPHLRRLSLALLNSLEMETNDVKILEERQTLLDYEADTFYSKEPTHVWKPRRYFKHFRDASVLAELLSVCQLLGKYGDLMTLVDHFLDLYHESSNYKLASVLIMNEIVLGAALSDRGLKPTAYQATPTPTDWTLLKDIIRMLLEEYLSQENLRLVDFQDERLAPVSAGKSSSTSLNVWQPHPSMEIAAIAARNHAVLLTVLFMEGIGKFAEVLSGDFHEHLIETLYPLVETLGHENVHLSSTAYITLTHICTACGYSSVGQLLQANTDYLLNSVSLRLRHFKSNQRTPRVLSVMLRYCSQDLLPLLDHSITEILDTLDDHHSEYLVLFMPVLLELTSAIGRWFPSTSVGSEENSIRHPIHLSKEIDPASVVSFVEDLAKQRKILDGGFTDDEIFPGKERTLADIERDMKELMKEREKAAKHEEEQEEDEGEKDTKKCPKHIQVVKDIFQRVKNLLSSKDPRVRLQTLEIVSQGCKDLSNYQSDLLPEIHQLWPSFYPRFHSEETFVTIKALQTLKIMADVSGDFIRQRVMKDVVPGLVQFMDKQAKISNESRSAYAHTNNFKLQLAVLTVVGPLAKKMSVDGSHLGTMAEMCLPYLSCLQPEHLQKACLGAFSHFMTVDADAIWLILCESYCPFQLQPPSEEFCSLKTLQDAQQENFFTKNIKQIFNLNS